MDSYLCGQFLSGFLLQYTEAYPGTITNSDITEKPQVLYSVPRGKTVMTDKGFNVTDSCHQRVFLYNGPQWVMQQSLNSCQFCKSGENALLNQL